jgi:hypothetical protein
MPGSQGTLAQRAAIALARGADAHARGDRVRGGHAPAVGHRVPGTIVSTVSAVVLLIQLRRDRSPAPRPAVG